MELLFVEQVPRQTWSFHLDNQECRIRLYQSGRAMYMDLDVDGAAVARGMLCRQGESVNQSPTHRFRGHFLFAGEDGSIEPHFSNTGKNLKLYYLTDEEWQEYEAGRDLS